MSFEQCTTTNKSVTIGLFGTCGESNWRQKFIDTYKEERIQWFNPNKKDWRATDAKNEARHLIDDDIVLFPILGSELGTASLSESSFSVLRAMTERKAKFTIIIVEPIDSSLEEKFGIDAYKGSKNARDIVLAHLKEVEHDHVYVVDKLNDMLSISLLLHEACDQIKRAKKIENKND